MSATESAAGSDNQRSSSAAVINRTREIGVLRAVGAGQRTVAATVIVEAAALCAGAVLLAVPLGSILGFLVARSVGTRQGFRTGMVFPWRSTPLLVLVAIVVVGFACALPARRAARMDPVSALRFD